MVTGDVSLSKDEAIARARQLLADAGLDPGDVGVHLALSQAAEQLPFGPPRPAAGGFAAGPSSTSTQSVPSGSGLAAPSSAPDVAVTVELGAQVAAAVQLRHYSPPRAPRWTNEELQENPNIDKCTRQLRCAAVVEHPLGAVVEFPESGSMIGESIAHRFAVDPDAKYRPHHNFQYSLSDDERHGSTKGVNCHLIMEGKQVKCKSVEYGCGCLRMCSFNGTGPYECVDHESNGHYYTSPSEESISRAHEHSAAVASASLAEVEVFRRTFAFFCGILKHGCSLRQDPAYAGALDDESDSYSSGSDCEAPEDRFYRDSRSQLRPGCTGTILMRRNDHGHSYLVCEHRSKTDPNHLILRNLQDLDLPYLRALLENDSPTIQTYEHRAAAIGVGPLVPCRHARSPRSQAQYCPNWHRDKNGKLAPGVMERGRDCPARFRIFEPHDIHQYPFILVVCTSPHSHRPPERTKTPPLLRDALTALLLDMRWQLADATPRRIMQDAGFVTNLRRLLQWNSTSPGDPTLAALHPSLGNLDHLEYLIETVRKPVYPSGTDFDGACDLLQQHLRFPSEERYIRYAAEFQLPGSKKSDRMVICMLPSQSRQLLDAKRVEVDISFKRVTSWYEYEMVTWDYETSQSVTLCRAFMTSMSAEAHLALYREVFKIAELDTGRKPRFCHLHGDGFEIWTADDDKGHALGLGLYVQELARNLDTYDKYDISKRLCDLSPYEHLARFLRLCIVHFKRNIKRLQHRVSPAVYDAMWSLAASETHLDFAGACDRIRNGGKAAANWLKEKELFALAALYQPLSKIPLNIWLAGNATTNGVEQKHRDVYRDGKSLTLIGGINRGMQHDLREIEHAALVRNESVSRRYSTADHGVRQYRRIHRAAQVEKRKVAPVGDDTLGPITKRATPAAGSQLPPTTALPSYLTTVPIPICIPSQNTDDTDLSVVP